MTKEICFLNGKRCYIRGIKSGGMSNVFLLEIAEGPCVQFNNEQFVAAKIFKSVQSVGEIKRELSIWLPMEHGNILPLITIGDLDDVFSAVSPWRREGSLKINTLAGLGLDALFEVIHQSCLALDYAWQEHGVIHLDIKPENIFFSQKNKKIEIGDWGVSSISSAKSCREILHSNNSEGGTVLFMAPERFSENYVPNIRADIYSLGMIILMSILKNPVFSDEKSYVQSLFSGDFYERVKELSKTLPSYVSSTLLSTLDPCVNNRPDKYSDVVKLIKGQLKSTPRRSWLDNIMKIWSP